MRGEARTFWQSRCKHFALEAPDRAFELPPYLGRVRQELTMYGYELEIDDRWCIEQLGALIREHDWMQVRRDVQRFVNPPPESRSNPGSPPKQRDGVLNHGSVFVFGPEFRWGRELSLPMPYACGDQTLTLFRKAHPL